jgi:hypothetical protein
VTTEARPGADDDLATAISTFNRVAARVVTDPARWTEPVDGGTAAAATRPGTGRMARLVDRFGRLIERQLDDASVRLDLDVQPIALSSGVTRPGFTPERAG